MYLDLMSEWFLRKSLFPLRVNCENLLKYINYSVRAFSLSLSKLETLGFLISKSFIIDKNKSFKFKMMRSAMKEWRKKLIILVFHFESIHNIAHCDYRKKKKNEVEWKYHKHKMHADIPVFGSLLNYTKCVAEQIVESRERKEENEWGILIPDFSIEVNIFFFCAPIIHFVSWWRLFVFFLLLSRRLKSRTHASSHASIWIF